MDKINQNALDQIFFQARTHHGWLDRPVPNHLLEELYAVLKWGPTSANCCPLRIRFIKTFEAKENLLGCLDKGNIEQTRTAPVTAILGYDLEFYEKLPYLAPHADMKKNFIGKPQLIESTAFRNGSLQGAYFIIAARALGLDCGPMSGFSNEKVDSIFFEGTQIRSNFLCNIGYGNPSKLHPRAPRLEFNDVCEIL